MGGGRRYTEPLALIVIHHATKSHLFLFKCSETISTFILLLAVIFSVEGQEDRTMTKLSFLSFKDELYIVGL